VRTHVFGKIVVNKNPCLARFGTRQQSQLGTAAHFFRVHVKEGSGLLQIERVHFLSA
jgi:hypothetical protein